MRSFTETDQDDTINAVTVRVIRTDEGELVGFIVPAAGEDTDAHREGAVVVLSVYGQAFPVPEALARAQAYVASRPDLERVVVQVHPEAEWNAEWGDLLPLHRL